MSHGPLPNAERAVLEGSTCGAAEWPSEPSDSPVLAPGRPDSMSADIVERLRDGVFGLNRIALCAEAADEITRLRTALAERAAVPAEPASGAWDGAEEWMPLAWELCADECGEDACNELVWEGGPIPEPWGERWLKYEGEAKRLIALVRKHVPMLAAAPQPPAERAAVPAQVVEAAQALLDELDGLIGETQGVYGLHLNGDPSPWSEIVEGGRFERLSSLEALRAALTAQPAAAPESAQARVAVALTQGQIDAAIKERKPLTDEDLFWFESGLLKGERLAWAANGLTAPATEGSPQ